MTPGATLDAVQVAGVGARVNASAEVSVENVALAAGATMDPPRDRIGATEAYVVIAGGVTTRAVPETNGATELAVRVAGGAVTLPPRESD